MMQAQEQPRPSPWELWDRTALQSGPGDAQMARPLCSALTIPKCGLSGKGVTLGFGLSAAEANPEGTNT